VREILQRPDRGLVLFEALVVMGTLTEPAEFAEPSSSGNVVNVAGPFVIILASAFIDGSETCAWEELKLMILTLLQRKVGKSGGRGSSGELGTFGRPEAIVGLAV
jgi:hypothetical protein